MQVIPYEEPSIQIDGPEPRGVLVVPVTLGANANIAVNANAFLNANVYTTANANVLANANGGFNWNFSPNYS